MNIGDQIYIRNRAGKLTVRLNRRLDLGSVARSMGHDRLPAIASPRWEFHQGKYGEHLITLCDETGQLPGTIYIAFWDCYDEPEIWEGQFDATEEPENVYETIDGNTQ